MLTQTEESNLPVHAQHSQIYNRQSISQCPSFYSQQFIIMHIHNTLQFICSKYIFIYLCHKEIGSETNRNDIINTHELKKNRTTEKKLNQRHTHEHTKNKKNYPFMKKKRMNQIRRYK